MITTEEKRGLVRQFGKDENDTGASEVQIAIFSRRIDDLTDHLQDNPNDHATRRGLLQLVGKRRKLLDYLMENDIERYRSIIGELGLRK